MDANEFLKLNDMHYSLQSFDSLKQSYLEHMNAGLVGKPSTLYMIPSYLSGEGTVPLGEKVIVLDAGGTNLRIALLHFADYNKPIIDHLEKHRMPGTEGEIGVDEFFLKIAGYIIPYCDCVSTIGLCFSYVCEIQPNGDGKLLNFCKEVKVRDSSGIMVCECLETALKKLGAKGSRKYRLINDTVAAMLGAKAVTDSKKYDDYIGFILGTGTNICYDENCSAIVKNPKIRTKTGKMIINMESGCFGALLRGNADLIVDAQSEFPNDHIAEKMIAGRYFGAVLTATLKLAASQGVLSSLFLDGIGNNIDMKQIGDFCLDSSSNNVISNLCASKAEHDFCIEIVDALFERAAKICAAALAAIAEKTNQGVNKPICVCAEGTTINKNPVLLPKIKRYILKEVTQKNGVQFDFITVNDVTLYGTAFAGLSK